MNHGKHFALILLGLARALAAAAEPAPAGAQAAPQAQAPKAQAPQAQAPKAQAPGAQAPPAAPAAAADEAYPIKLHPPSKAGDEYDVEIKWTLRGKSVSVDDFFHPVELKEALTLTARIKVDSVNDQGATVKKTLTVRKFVGLDGKELVAPGEVINLSLFAGKDHHVFQDGRAMAPALAQALQTLFPPMPQKTIVTLDDIWPSKTPRKVGESWAIDPKAAAELFTTQTQDIGGQATLKAVEQLPGGGRALRLEATALGRRAEPARLPSGAAMGLALMELKWDGLLPLEADVSVRQEVMTLKMSIPLNSGGVAGHVTATTRLTTTLTPVKK